MNIVLVGNFRVSYCSEVHHANTLEALGHKVTRLQESEVDTATIYNHALNSDLLIWVHTHGWHTPVRAGIDISTILNKCFQNYIPTMTYHLDLWLGLNRQNDLVNDPFYNNIEHFFTVDKLMAKWFNENTDVKGHYLPAGVYEPECYIAEPVKQPPHNVAFVGSRQYHKEWQYRPQLVDWLKLNYAGRFAHYGNDGLGVIRGDSLNRLYADTKVVVGDTLCINFDYPYYYSDRIFETTGRGGFIIHPYIKGLEDLFEINKEIVTYNYGDFNELKSKIDYYLEHDDEREAIRKAGHERTKKEHTYTQRWKTILKEIK